MKYEFKGTPAPWRWELNERYKNIELRGGKTKYDLIVMDFVIYGMNSAAPRFNNDFINSGLMIMERAELFGAIVEGREHHADWFKSIDHPDAHLIAAAPDLLEACITALKTFAAINVSVGYDGDSPIINELKQAIHKALNIQS